jgi:hypothetical protein
MSDLAAVPEPVDRSPLDDLRDLYRADAPRKPLELGIPASHGQLVVRYGAPTDRSQLSAVFRAVQSGAVLDDYADVDLVVDCAKDILRVHGNQLVPLVDDGRPLRFDQTFKDDEYPLSIAGHFQSLVGWLQGFGDDALERVEKNSAGPSGA